MFIKILVMLRKEVKAMESEAVFLVSLGRGSFPTTNELYRKTVEKFMPS